MRYHLTPWIRCLLNNLTVAQIVSKFSAFYRTQNIHYLVQKALPVVLILSQMNVIYNIPSFSSRFTLILSSCQYLCLQSGFFHLCVTTKPYMHSSSSPMCATCPTHLLVFDLSPWTLLVRCTSNDNSYAVFSNHLSPPVLLKYSPQHLFPWGTAICVLPSVWEIKIYADKNK